MPSWFDDEPQNPYDDPSYTPPDGNIWTSSPPPPPPYTPDPFQNGQPSPPPPPPPSQSAADPAPDGTSQTGSTARDAYQFVREWQQRYGYSKQSLQDMVKAAVAAGFRITFADHRGRPSDDKIVMPDGRMFDIVRGVDGPDPGWAFQDVTDAHNAAQAGGGAGGPYTPFNFESYSQPAPFNFQPYDAPAPFSYQPFKPPEAFQAPTMEEATNDPGYQFRLREGQQALERSASARGTLLTTGTLKDLTNYGQEAATQQYQHVYNQELGEYAMNYENLFGAHNANLNAAQTAYGLNASTSLASYLANAQGGLNAHQTNLGAGQFGYNANFQNALAANNAANSNTSAYANNLYQLAALGQNASGSAYGY